MKEYLLEMLFLLHRQNKTQKMFDLYVKIFNQINDEYGSCQLQNKFVLFQLANDNKIFRISASVLLYEIEKLLTAANKKEGISLSCLEAFINKICSFLVCINQRRRCTKFRFYAISKFTLFIFPIVIQNTSELCITDPLK